MTAFNVGRTPAEPYENFTHETSLKGVRIGIVREYMDRSIATPAEYENIAIAERAVEDLRKLGATIVDPGPEGLFTDYVRRYNPMLSNSSWTKLFPELFPVDSDGKPTGDHIATLVDLAANPSKVPGKLTIRDFPAAQAIGETKYGFDIYLKERGDANIKTLDDLINKAKFYKDGQRSSPTSLITANSGMVMDTAVRLQRRFAIQQIILACMAELKLDAFVAPTGNVPPAKIAAQQGGGGGRGGRGGGAGGGAGGLGTWSFLGQQGIPAITVPGGFTTQVYDRVPDPSAPPPPDDASSRAGGVDGNQPRIATKLIGPFPAKLPVGIDFMGRPFSEPMLLKIAAAYERATHHRIPPPDFGPLAKETVASTGTR
jgi:Asp-tRNA(Asn)/Glu-tRNA(Gln) amidotransferase A subunit family amidase